MFVWFLNGKRLGELQTDDLRRGRKVIIFGSLRWNKRLTRLLNEVGRRNILCIYEPDPTEWGTEFERIPVLQPAAGQDVLVVSADQEWKSISAQAKALGYEDVYFFMSKEKTETIELYLETFAPYARYNVIPTSRTFKYVHMMPDEKFFSPVAEMIEYGLDPNEHFFFIYNMASFPANARYGSWEKYQDWMRKYQNIYLLQNRYPLYSNNWEENRASFDRLLEYADKMIFHGGWNIWFMEDYFRTKLDVIQKKGTCIPWSGSKEYDRERVRFLQNVVQYVRMVATSHKELKSYLVARFEPLQSAIWIDTGLSYARITKIPPRRERKTKNILVAHSANAYTNAIETLSYLSDIDESFQIYCITAYGAQAGEIEAYGKEIYGDRFTPVNRFMEYDQYVEFLSTIDAAVLGMEAMAGRNTLELLFWLGVKVYLKPGSDVWNRMVYEKGYRPADYYSVKNLTADELLDNPDKGWNHSVASAEYDADEKVRQWRKLFEYDWGN